MKYFHVDVFSEHPLAGNGLTVVFPDRNLDFDLMLKITQEFKQFETTFVFPAVDHKYPVRIFTAQEELEFAGHPILGTAGLLHKLESRENQAGIDILLGKRCLQLKSECKDGFYKVRMNQGVGQWIKELKTHEIAEMHSWFNLQQDEIRNDYPISVVSTGLPYLLLPVNKCLDKIKICINDLEKRIKEFGAKFVYFFDPDTLECRTWDNTGIYEDVATGSAAGPLIAYLVTYGYRNKNDLVTLSQGKYLQRESKITGSVNEKNEVTIEGAVSIFGQGEIFI